MTDAEQLELAEKLQRRRTRIMAAQALIFVFWQWSFVTSLPNLEGPLRGVDKFKISAFIVWAAMLLLLLARGGMMWRGRNVRHLLNDEMTREHFRSAFTWGYWAAMVSCFVLYVVSLFEPIGLMVVLHLLLTAGIAMPLIRFVYLERRSDAAQ